MWAVWRIVNEKKIALSEIDKWDLEDIASMNAILDMEADYDAALEGYRNKD